MHVMWIVGAVLLACVLFGAISGKGTIPFFVGDLTVLLLVIFFPALATWLPALLTTDVFK